ncbi:MAG: hypothetical protein NT140_04650 [Deltaproteobacteria bacterium]|nr:hypothetical protein [Deltaproteobacteria bacterium]
MFVASNIFFKLRDLHPKDTEQYEHYEAMRRLSSNVEELLRKLDAVERVVNQLPKK